MYTQEQIGELIEKCGKFDAVALKKLGIACFTGNEGAKKDWKLAEKCLRAAIFEGEMDAADALSALYFSQNHPGAAVLGYVYCRMGAEAGVTGCIKKIGDLYQQGRGPIEANLVLAIEWFTKAAERGNVDAMAQLGEMYYFGNGTPVDYESATNWLEKAARKGHVLSMYNLGVMYDQRWYDDANAGYWFNEAAQRGHKQAQDALRSYKFSSFSNKWKKIQ